MISDSLIVCTAPHYEASRANELVELAQDLEKLQAMDVDTYVDLYAKK